MRLLALLILVFSLPAQALEHEKIISIADIHFDPFAGCRISVRSCQLLSDLRHADVQNWKTIFEKQPSMSPAGKGHDTNYSLLKIVIAGIKKTAHHTHPAFGLVMGDSLAHGFHRKYIFYTHDFSKAGYISFVKKTLRFMTDEIKTVLPDINIYTLPGNNDSYAGNYNVVANGKFFQDTALIWSTLINDKKGNADMRQSFPRAGYYAVTLPQHPDLRLVLLNSVLFSEKVSGPGNRPAASAEIAWLHQQLVLARKQHWHVLLALHIPPGPDYYTTFWHSRKNTAQFWQKDYTQQFEHEIHVFAPEISAILAAHVHKIILALLPEWQIANVPVRYTPSVSPIYGNPPSIKIFSYDPENFRLTGSKTLTF